MALPILRNYRRSRYRRYLIVSLFLFFTYYFWPMRQIEQISDTMHKSTTPNLQRATFKQNEEQADEKQANVLYDTGSDPLRANFNPDNKNIEVPKVIKLDKVNEALSSLNLRPLDNVKDQQIASSSRNRNFLSEKITSLDFTPINNFDAFIGNKGIPTTNNYFTDLACSQIKYNAKEERQIYHSDPIELTDDLDEIRDYLEGTEYRSLVTKYADTASVDHTSNSWYRFSGGSVWLSDEQVHLLVSRIIYAPLQKNYPIASFLRLQIFDSEWQEIKGKRIRFIDLTDRDVDTILRKYDETKDDSVLDGISLKFPSILNIPFDVDTQTKELLGPEDPRIVFKDGEVTKEPIIFFNMLNKGKRNMNFVFPLRKPNKNGKPDVTPFKLNGKSLATTDVEKNWSPFFDTLKVGDTKKSKGSIHFVYTYDPLVILKCNLDNGKCEKIQNNFEYSTLAQNGEAYIRGGSDLRPIPRQVIQLLNEGDSRKRLQMWVGFAKTHVKNCGCGDVTYRPSLVLLIKEDGVFRLELMSDSLDFGIDVKAYNGKSTRCERKAPSVLTPNGISFWDIKITEQQSESEKKTPLFEDHMALMLSEADANVEVIFLKNILNYIFGIYEEGKYMLGDYDLEEGVLDRTRKVTECMLESSFEYCAAYGASHSGSSIKKSTE